MDGDSNHPDTSRGDMAPTSLKTIGGGAGNSLRQESMEGVNDSSTMKAFDILRH